jgi:hypothetical protein
MGIWIAAGVTPIVACAADEPTSPPGVAPEAPRSGLAPDAGPSPSDGAAVGQGGEADGSTLADAGSANGEREGSTTADAEASNDAAPGGNDGSAASFTPPSVDGLIERGEYGDEREGRNASAAPPDQRYLATWSDDAFYLALDNANAGEGLVLYMGTMATSESSASVGTSAGYTYDGTRITQLPFRAIFVLYTKATYTEVRWAQESGGWSAPLQPGSPSVAGLAQASDASARVRELRVPWTLLRLGTLPTRVRYFAYVTSQAGSVYAPLPTGNPTGSIGLDATFSKYFVIDPVSAPLVRWPFASPATSP